MRDAEVTGFQTVSTNSHNPGKVLAAAAAQPLLMEGAALEICLRTGSSSHSSL